MPAMLFGLLAEAAAKANGEMRREIESVLALAKNLGPDELAAFLGELETVRVTALARIASPADVKPDHMLDVEETAQRMHCSRDYLYRHHRKFPFTRRIGRRLLFSSAGIDSYLRKPR
jgi:hypothetical protein